MAPSSGLCHSSSSFQKQSKSRKCRAEMRLWCLCHCCCRADAQGGLSHRPAMAVPCFPPLLLQGRCSGGSSGSPQPLLGDMWGSSRNQSLTKLQVKKITPSCLLTPCSSRITCVRRPGCSLRALPRTSCAIALYAK